MKIPVVIPFFLLFLPFFQEQKGEWYLRAKPEDVKWWKDAKFGVFICWGPISILGKEIGWSRKGPRPGRKPPFARTGVPVEIYDSLYKKFNPTKFNADEWADIVKRSGAKYIIFLTKHHDGFCMFDSKYTDYCIRNTPYGRDVTAEIARAFRKKGIRIFWYYSPPDWHHPDYRTKNHKKYIEYLHNQIRELCTKYGEIAGIWFDGLGGKPEDWDAKGLFRMIRTLQPHALINNRAGLKGDFDTPEQRIGRFELERPWESCITMQRSGWSWRPDQPLKSLKTCIRLLVKCAGGGGNLALDIGPMPDGRINPEQARRLLDMGAWLKKYGESIYGTTGGPYKPGTWWGCSTRKGNAVYLHVFSWKGKEIVLPPMPARIKKCEALTGGKPEFRQDEKGLKIILPKEFHDPIDTIIKLELEGSAMDIDPIDTPIPGCISMGKMAFASGAWSRGYSAEKAFDGDMRTRWGAPKGARKAWISVDFGREMEFQKILVFESPWNRVKRFRLEYKKGGKWITFHQGKGLGNLELELKSPLRSRFVRLQVLEATDAPTIWEIQIFAPPKAFGKEKD